MAVCHCVVVLDSVCIHVGLILLAVRFTVPLLDEEQID